VADERAHLAQADRHIAECEVSIARQERLIAWMEQRGQRTDLALETLQTFKVTLQGFENHRRQILKQLGRER
jgi:hypothetical protein